MKLIDRTRFMRFPSPVGAGDAVDTGGLPPELQGKSPAEIAAYYADREDTILANARRLVNEAREANSAPGNTPPPSNQPPSGPQFVTRQEFDNITATAQEGLINMAQMTAASGKPDWDRLLPEIRKIVQTLPPAQQVNAAIWTEAYFNVRGRMTDTLVTEARNRALGLEAPSPAPPMAAKPRVFTDGEMKVIEGVGITPEMYADAERKLDSGFHPFTTDNRRGAAR